MRREPMRCPVAIIGLCSVLASWSPSLAVGQEDESHRQNQLVIETVYVDTHANTVTILGENLGAAGSPIVRLGAYPDPLTIFSHAPRSIEAELPSDLREGDYLLTVSTGLGIGRNDVFDLTIGAVGPEGTKGIPGEPGDKGEKGDSGDKGDEGSTGAVGPRGPQGADGDTGPEGPAGPPGSAGVPFQVRQAVLSPRNDCLECILNLCLEQSLTFRIADLTVGNTVVLDWDASDSHAWVEDLAHTVIPASSPDFAPGLGVDYTICTGPYRGSRLVNIYVEVDP